MKILHYSLGLPPFRTGGLTKYSYDLIKHQIDTGNNVSLLFPGHFNLSNKTFIKKDGKKKGLEVYEIVNPLLVSLLGGISDPLKFMEDIYSIDIYISFLKKIDPHIIHIHTLMGIHKEFFIAAKNLNIKMVFTTHDYFGICPKVNLIDNNGEICMDNENGSNCVSCNQNTYSIPLIYFMQSKTYRVFKENKIVKKMRSNKKNEFLIEEKRIDKIDNELAEKFNRLRSYHFEIFNMIDFFLFNSESTKVEFNKHLDIKGEVIPVSHNNIYDNRKIKKYEVNRPLKISFLGPLDQYKGFPQLRESLNWLLSHNKTNWELNVYGNNSAVALEQSESEYIFFHGRYYPEELANIFDNTDVLVIPSIWKETFGFIGLEALSFGVPILVSEHVGCKDIIKDGETGIIFKSDANELARILEDLIQDRNILIGMNQNINDSEFLYSLDKHEKDIKALYKKIIGEL